MALKPTEGIMKFLGEFSNYVRVIGGGGIFGGPVDAILKANSSFVNLFKEMQKVDDMKLMKVNDILVNTGNLMRLDKGDSVEATMEAVTQFIKEAVTIYLTMISPQVEQIMNLKYSFSSVEYNETDNTFHLYQPIYTLNENQENYPGAANEEIISFEIVKTFIPIQKRTRRKKPQTKNVKSRNKRRETAQQMDEMNSKIISDSVSSVSSPISESSNSTSNSKVHTRCLS